MDIDTLQSVVDDLAERLQRSVAVDDPSIRLLASSRHFGEEDALRSRSILEREVPVDVVEVIRGMGIEDWVAPGWIEDAAIGLTRRLCVPVRCQGLLMGFLWLIDRPTRPIDRDAVDRAAVAAAQAGVLLYRGRLTSERLRNRHESLLRELVSSDDAARAQAVEDLHAEEVFSRRSPHHQVLAVRAEAAPDGQEDADLQVAVQNAVARTPTDSAVAVVGPARGWILLTGSEPWSEQRVDHLCDQVVRGASATFGLGSVVTDLADVHVSYRQALMAARAACNVASFSSRARWDDLGPYQLLLRMTSADVAAVASVPALTALEEADPHGILVQTLETYLDRAGDVRGAAEVLCVHRATFYQRLRRIEEISGCDLASGSDRLLLHLGLKIRALDPSRRLRH